MSLEEVVTNSPADLKQNLPISFQCFNKRLSSGPQRRGKSSWNFIFLKIKCVGTESFRTRAGAFQKETRTRFHHPESGLTRAASQPGVAGQLRG